MTELIAELLRSHNCVVIPGFGALIGNYSPSEIILSEHKIIPPRKSIVFNRSLQKNDGILITGISSSLDIPYVDAEGMASKFAKECNESLSSNGSLILKGIGRFTLDENQKVQFQASLSENFLPESFGLQSLSLEPIHRLKDAHEEITENYNRKMHPEKLQDVLRVKTVSGVPYWVMAGLALTFLFSSLGWNIHKGRTNVNYSSVIPSITDTREETKPLVVTPLKTAIVPVLPVPAVTVPQKTTSASVKRSYIVVGAFFDDIHANKVKAEAEAKGYNVHLATGYNNTLYRVYVEVENENVSSALQHIKAGFNERAWVYCTNCILN